MNPNYIRLKKSHKKHAVIFLCLLETVLSNCSFTLKHFSLLYFFSFFFVVCYLIFAGSLIHCAVAITILVELSVKIIISPYFKYIGMCWLLLDTQEIKAILYVMFCRIIWSNIYTVIVGIKIKIYQNKNTMIK